MSETKKPKKKTGGRAASLANLNPAKEGEVRNPHGRPKMLKTILKEQGMTKDEIRHALGSVLLMNEARLKEIFDDADAPVFFQILARTMNKAKSKGFSELRSMFEYIQPKAQTNVSIETKDSLEDKSPEELIALREQIKKGLDK